MLLEGGQDSHPIPCSDKRVPPNDVRSGCHIQPQLEVLLSGYLHQFNLVANKGASRLYHCCGMLERANKGTKLSLGAALADSPGLQLYLEPRQLLFWQAELTSYGVQLEAQEGQGCGGTL